jgi:regulator of protease activity HflC (stomatin/prohibitin superfamily)
MNPYKASYGVEDPEFAVTQLAQTMMRSEIGKITLDTLFRERDNLNAAIVRDINQVGFFFHFRWKAIQLVCF